MFVYTGVRAHRSVYMFRLPLGAAAHTYGLAERTQTIAAVAWMILTRFIATRQDSGRGTRGRCQLL